MRNLAESRGSYGCAMLVMLIVLGCAPARYDRITLGTKRNAPRGQEAQLPCYAKCMSLAREFPRRFGAISVFWNADGVAFAKCIRSISAYQWLLFSHIQIDDRTEVQVDAAEMSRLVAQFADHPLPNSGGNLLGALARFSLLPNLTMQPTIEPADFLKMHAASVLSERSFRKRRNAEAVERFEPTREQIPLALLVTIRDFHDRINYDPPRAGETDCDVREAREFCATLLMAVPSDIWLPDALDRLLAAANGHRLYSAPPPVHFRVDNWDVYKHAEGHYELRHVLSGDRPPWALP